MKFTKIYFRRHPLADKRIVFPREDCAEENHVTVYIELLYAGARKRKVA